MNKTILILLAVICLAVMSCAIAQTAAPEQPPTPPAGPFVGHPLPPPPPPAAGTPATPGAGMMPPMAPGMMPGGGMTPGPMMPAPIHAAMPGMMPHAAPSPEAKIASLINLLDVLRRTCFNPELSAMAAIGAIKDEPGKPEEKIATLEVLLDKTKTLGLRNAIRMSLKDLYKAQGQNDKALSQLQQAVLENDQAIRTMAGDGDKPVPHKPAKESKESDEDDDEDD